MKPRLKRMSDGRLLVVAPGLNPWGETSARTFLLEHYGSIAAFAKRFALPYDAVCTALRGWPAPQMAGQVALVRQILGLPSNPSSTAIAAARSKARQRGEIVEPDWVFGVEVQP